MWLVKEAFEGDYREVRVSGREGFQEFRIEDLKGSVGRSSWVQEWAWMVSWKLLWIVVHRIEGGEAWEWKILLFVSFHNLQTMNLGRSCQIFFKTRLLYGPFPQFVIVFVILFLSLMVLLMRWVAWFHIFSLNDSYLGGSPWFLPFGGKGCTLRGLWIPISSYCPKLGFFSELEAIEKWRFLARILISILLHICVILNVLEFFL